MNPSCNALDLASLGIINARSAREAKILAPPDEAFILTSLELTLGHPTMASVLAHSDVSLRSGNTDARFARETLILASLDLFSLRPSLNPPFYAHSSIYRHVMRRPSFNDGSSVEIVSLVTFPFPFSFSISGFVLRVSVRI